MSPRPDAPVLVRVRRLDETGSASIEPVDAPSAGATAAVVPRTNQVGVLREHALAHAFFEGAAWATRVVRLEGHRIPGRASATRAALLDLLEGGERHVLQLARALRLRESGVRRHLARLEQEGAVEAFFRQVGRGRPKKFYRLRPRRAPSTTGAVVAVGSAAVGI